LEWVVGDGERDKGRRWVLLSRGPAKIFEREKIYKTQRYRDKDYAAVCEKKKK
jgi:hypothetical protein